MRPCRLQGVGLALTTPARMGRKERNGAAAMLSGLWRMRGDASDNLPHPAQSRRRARLRGGAILAGLAVLTATPSALNVARHREPGNVAVGFAAFGTLLIAVVSQLMANSDWSVWHLRGERNHLLAARTMTGWRTIDLTGIRRVHLCSLPDRYRPGAHEYLVVIDASGSRIGVKTTDEAAIRSIHDAVVASTSTGVRVSRLALISLGIHRREFHRYLPCRNAHPLLYALAIWIVLIAIYSSAVTLLQQ